MEILIGLVLFLIAALGFYTGLRLGFRMAKGVEPPEIKSPVKIIKEAAERREVEREQEAEQDYWEKIDGNDGYTDQERAWINGAKG